MSRCLDGLETIIATHLARDKEQELTSDQGRDEGLSRIQLIHVLLEQGQDCGVQPHYEIPVLLKEKWASPTHQRFGELPCVLGLSLNEQEKIP